MDVKCQTSDAAPIQAGVRVRRVNGTLTSQAGITHHGTRVGTAVRRPSAGNRQIYDRTAD